jgi:hypothetical protein
MDPVEVAYGYAAGLADFGGQFLDMVIRHVKNLLPDCFQSAI